MAFLSDMFNSGKGAGFNAGTATHDNANLTKAYGNVDNAYNQMQNLANGQGPNPAQNMLNQATGQNNAAQTAMMADARGAGSNPGLAARQAAMQGSANQQNAIGQAATMNSQQQLGATQQLGQQALQNQSNQMQMQSNINNNNAAIAQANQKSQSDTAGGILGGIGSAFGLAEGGEVPEPTGNPFLDGWAKAGKTMQNAMNGGVSASHPLAPMSSGTSSLIGGVGKMIGNAMTPEAPTASAGASTAPTMSAKGPANIMMAAKGGHVETGSKLKAGGHVPGKPKVSGDSLKNDNVHALLSPGEVVIPRSVAQSSDPVGNSAKFVAGVMAKRKNHVMMADGGEVPGADEIPAEAAPAVATTPKATAPRPPSGSSKGNVTSPTDTSTETGGSSPGGASTGGVGSGIGGAGTGGAATGGASTGGAGTVNVTISGNSGTGSNDGAGGKDKGKAKGKAGGKPININISNVGGTTDAGNVASGDGPGSSGTGGRGDGSGGGGGGAAPSEPSDMSSSRKASNFTSAVFAKGGGRQPSKRK